MGVLGVISLGLCTLKRLGSLDTVGYKVVMRRLSGFEPRAFLR